MRYLRQTLFLILVIFTFVGSIGVGIFSHFCSKDGMEQSFFIPKEHHCQEIKKSVPACCQHEETNAEKDCCSDEVQYVQTDFDFFQQNSAYVFVPFQLPTAFFEGNKTPLAVSEISSENFANPPPKPIGREILIKNQVFRI